MIVALVIKIYIIIIIVVVVVITFYKNNNVYIPVTLISMLQEYYY